MTGDKFKIPTQNAQGWLELTSFLTAKVISGWPVLLLEETGVTRINNQHILGNDYYSTCTRFWWYLNPGSGVMYGFNMLKYLRKQCTRD